MTRTRMLAGIVIGLVIISGCLGDDGIGPEFDRDPPVWDSEIGIISLDVGDSQITAHWGTATDEKTPPVVYLVYLDTDNSPWDQSPIERTSNEPYTFTELTNDMEYWIGVRCRDSVDPPNIDQNEVVISSSPKENAWARVWGAEDFDMGVDVALDSSGNIIVSGIYSRTVDFDPGTGTNQHVSNGNNDTFLSKFDPDGNHLWTKTWGGVGNDDGKAIYIDSFGDILVSGSFGNVVDFDPGSGVEEHSAYKYQNIFLSKYRSNGDYMWTRTFLGDPECLMQYGPDSGLGDITVDANGNIILTGRFNGIFDFDPGPSEFNLDGDSALDSFICKLDSSGNLIWAKQLIRDGYWYGPRGGGNGIYGNAILTDSSGAIFVAGTFCGTVDFDPNSGEFVLSSSEGYKANGFDAFLGKYDSNASFIWAGVWGYGWAGSTSDSDGCSDIALDDAGNVYTAGWFSGTVDFDPGPDADEQTITSADSAAFLSKFSNDCAYQWVRVLAVNSGGVSGIHLDNSGFISAVGTFDGLWDFDPGPSEVMLDPVGLSDIFVCRLNLNGDFISACAFGGTSDEYSASVTSNPDGELFIVGSFGDTADFDPDTDVLEYTSNGYYDAFLLKLSSL